MFAVEVRGCTSAVMMPDLAVPVVMTARQNSVSVACRDEQVVDCLHHHNRSSRFQRLIHLREVLEVGRRREAVMVAVDSIFGGGAEARNSFDNL